MSEEVGELFLQGIKRDDHGFTLIELLIVIVVLGILAAVVILHWAESPERVPWPRARRMAPPFRRELRAFKAQNTGTTVTSSLLTGTTDGGPYVQSWPANTPHYAFAISDGTATYVIPSTVTGTVSTTSPVYAGIYPVGTTSTRPERCWSRLVTALFTLAPPEPGPTRPSRARVATSVAPALGPLSRHRRHRGRGSHTWDPHLAPTSADLGERESRFH